LDNNSKTGFEGWFLPGYKTFDCRGLA